MKKIFAIALAVVMVLSMASAFALSTCATWGTNWPCNVDADLCGKGSVEVVPYVKVNTSCGWEWQVSDCAAAIKTENVYWAIKLTVDANPDPDWWEQATLEIETTGLTSATQWAIDLNEVFINTEFEAGEYYLAADWSEWLDLEDWEDLDSAQDQWAYIFTATVDNLAVCDNNGYDVCATLASYYDGFSVADYNVAGDYEYSLKTLTDESIVAFDNLDDDGMTDVLTIKDEDGNVVTFTITDGYIAKEDRSKATAAFYNDVMADFGFAACGTEACINEVNFQANFGWNDEQEDCFDWSEKGAAVVDTDCVVAIPKTGDASVLAWLF